MKKTTQMDTKENLRRQTLKLFAERGYNAVSMRNIADAVGVRQGAIYNHFPSKQDLLVDLMVHHMEKVLKAVDAALAHVEGPTERLRKFSHFHVNYHIDFPDDVFIAYMELRSLSPENYQLISGLRGQYEAKLQVILEEGRKLGHFNIESSFVHGRALLSMLTGVTLWYKQSGKIGRDKIVDGYVHAALQSVGITH